jgi:hypothetical protein
MDAFIGAGAGVAVGIAFVNGLCDGSHCDTSNYVQSGVYFGAMGSAIGALIGYQIDLSHRKWKARSSSRPTITMAPMISPDARGGRVALRF